MKGIKLAAWTVKSCYLVYLLLLAALFAVGAEVILRSKGMRPWHPGDVSFRVEPGGKFFRPDPVLGYSHLPGQFTVIYNSGYSFKATNLPTTLRVTRPVGSAEKTGSKGAIWIFGCSFTYGWSVNDEENYPWLLQQRFADYDVVNFGVNGYATIHALHQFEAALDKETPAVAILAYADFHDERNVFSRRRRKAVAPWNKLGPLNQPYARLDDSGGLRYLLGTVEYQEFPLMRYSALAHVIENKYDQYELNRLHPHAVSELLVAEMARLAKRHGVIFVVANINGGSQMLEFAQQKGILNVDIAVDLTVPGSTNLPHDCHPSAASHVVYADRLERFLRAELAALRQP